MQKPFFSMCARANCNEKVLSASEIHTSIVHALNNMQFQNVVPPAEDQGLSLLPQEP